MDDTLANLGAVKRLLLLEEEGVALVRDAADVERMARIRDRLTKVAGVDRRVILRVAGLGEAGEASRGLGGAIIHAAEELGTLEQAWIDAGDLGEYVLDEGGHVCGRRQGVKRKGAEREGSMDRQAGGVVIAHPPLFRISPDQLEVDGQLGVMSGVRSYLSGCTNYGHDLRQVSREEIASRRMSIP
jgi:hypothetical protein